MVAVADNNDLGNLLSLALDHNLKIEAACITLKQDYLRKVIRILRNSINEFKTENK